MSTMTAVYAALAAPFVAAVVGLLAGPRRPGVVVPLAVGGTGISLLATAFLALRAVAAAPLSAQARLAEVPTGGPSFGIDLRVDGLAALVSLAVGVVAFAVQVYSTAYLHGDPRYSSYAALVSLFTAAMLLVVFADDLLVLLVGWEVMGVCSYFLIGHHWEQEGARAGAIKALVTTRLGDVGFLFGIFALATAAQTFSITGVLDRADTAFTERTVTVATLLLLCGVVGKSAQFPLHTWLPDAMAGPTPVSALIHAATMVAAGIYLVMRLFPLFLLSPTTLAVMAVIACVTMLGAALAALGQDDIKRVLAYSTVSQLAYMLAALSVGSVVAADFHLLTHAAFKALLFLAAGSVIHAVGTNLMPDMGGLRRAMPLTFLTMTAGLAALAGVPPFSGFFSKEAVLGAAEHVALGEATGPRPWTGWLVLVVGLATVGVTAAYVTRLWLLTFFGPARGAVAAHEPGAAMRRPLLALAVPAVGLGLVGLRDSWLPAWVSGPGEREHLLISLSTSALSLLLVLAGAVSVWLAWRRDPAADPVRRLRLRPALERGFWVDELYAATLVRPTRGLARAVLTVDDSVVGEGVRRAGAGTLGLGRLAALSQRGNVQSYLTGVLAGVLLLALAVVTLG